MRLQPADDDWKQWEELRVCWDLEISLICEVL